MASDRAAPAQPLAGKTVVLVHAAWHSCGSHQVFVSQAKAYRAMGARFFSLAIGDEPGFRPKAQRAAYMAASADLVADGRAWTAMAPASLLAPPVLGALRRRLHGDQARLRLEIAKRAPIPPALAALRQIDIIHCHHFFCVPTARALRGSRDIPLLLDTQDVQARQYVLRNESSWTLPPAAAFEDMLAVELDAMRGADVLIHLNNEEAATFRALLPDKRHELLYPAVEPAPTGPGGADLVIIAAGNLGNVLSVEWFLREVMPLAPGLPVRIVGNVEAALRRRVPELHRQHAALFAGWVADPAAVYESAAAVILPTVAGHGISIKTIEALSSGLPLIAAPAAFRGMDVDPSRLDNVALATAPEAFAAALRAVAAKPPLSPAARLSSATRRYYDETFSDRAYRAALARILAEAGTAASAGSAIASPTT